MFFCIKYSNANGSSRKPLHKVLYLQMGHHVGGNFNSHIWACSGDFIVSVTVQLRVPTTLPRDKNFKCCITVY